MSYHDAHAVENLVYSIVILLTAIALVIVLIKGRKNRD